MDTFLIDVPIPSMGATVSELTVIDIKVAAGSSVKKGEKAAELESDKSVFEWEAPCDGTVREVFCRAGDIVPSGAPFMRIETSDASLAHLKAGAELKTPTPASAPAKSAPPPPPASTSPTPAAPSQLQWTP
ncbi:biotin/lipoyl-containing protein, partial [Geminisphaera colitermitum]|uniref:biotin/lipoyl-containing protein n=1 Tax=Geminisphaera colitermitum TaxID=1148786 RepID=UPI0005BE6E8E